MLFLELKKNCVVIVYVPLLWIFLAWRFLFFSTSTLSFLKFHAYHFFFWHIELELCYENGFKITAENLTPYCISLCCVCYKCICFGFGFIMTFINIRPRRLWKHWFGSKKSHSDRVRRLKCWILRKHRYTGGLFSFPASHHPPHQHSHLTPHTHTHTHTQTYFELFWDWYVPYPCFGIFINGVHSYVKWITYSIYTLIYGG